MEYALQRRLELDRMIETLAQRDADRDRGARLRCFRGVDTPAALTLVTERGDWRRFRSPRHLAAYVGLVPSEHSSGPTERTGRITKTGKAPCRHVLVHAAWHCRCIPQVGLALKGRQRGQPADGIATSAKAQRRLYQRYHHLAVTRGPQRAVVAVARELVGFLWAALQTGPQTVPAPGGGALAAPAPAAVDLQHLQHR